MRIGPNGSAHVIDSITMLLARGFGYQTDVGALTTPQSNGTILNLSQPTLVLSIPSGTTFRPLRVEMVGVLPILAADNDEFEFEVFIDRTAKWDGTGTSTAVTPLNLRTDLTTTCPVNGAKTFTGNITAPPVQSMQLSRMNINGDSQTAAGIWRAEAKLVYEPRYPPIVIGPAMFVLLGGGTAAFPHFANVTFLAVPSNLYTGLA